MTNLTLSLDEKLLKAARVRAAREGTSVNEICRKAVESYALADSGDRLQRFDAVMARIDAAPRGKRSRTAWKNREEMYAELMQRGSKV